MPRTGSGSGGCASAPACTVLLRPPLGGCAYGRTGAGVRGRAMLGGRRGECGVLLFFIFGYGSTLISRNRYVMI